MQAFATELQRGAVLRGVSTRPKARRLLKGGKYVPLKKEPKRGMGPAGLQKMTQLKERWESKKLKRCKSWPSRGLGGYVADEDELTDEIRDEAKKLQRSAYLMKEYLRRPSFVDACDETGILPSDLLPKPIEEFQKEENRAFDRSFAEQTAAYNDHEQYRGKLIRKVLVNEQRLAKAFEKKVALQKKEERQMAHLLKTSILQEKKRMDQMVAISEKIEKAKAYKVRVAKLDQQERQQQLWKREGRANEKISLNRKQLKDQLKAKIAERKKRQVQSATFRKERDAALEAGLAETRERRLKREKEAEEKLKKQREQFLKERKQAKNLAGARAEREAKRQLALRNAQDEKREKKEALLKKIRDDKEAERKMRIFKASLQFERRRRQVERLKLAQERQKEQLAQEVRIKEQRQFALREIKTAIAVERDNVMRDARISLDDFNKEHGRNVSADEPGPGHYTLPDVFLAKAAKPGLAGEGWSKRPKPKTEFDRIVDRAREIPAPGDYGELQDPHISSFHREGGEWGDYKKPKNEFEMAMDRANDTPAAQDYNPTPLKSNVGSVNMNGEKPLDTPLDITIRRAKDAPSPVQYSPPASPKPMRNLDQLRSELSVSVNVLGFLAKLKQKKIEKEAQDVEESKQTGSEAHQQLRQ